jgi:hypothetical protein
MLTTVIARFSRYTQGGEINGPSGAAGDYALDFPAQHTSIRDISAIFSSSGEIPVFLARCRGNSNSLNSFARLTRILSVEAYDCRVPLEGQLFRWYAGHLSYVIDGLDTSRTIYCTRFITTTEHTDRLCQIFALSISQSVALKAFLAIDGISYRPVGIYNGYANRQVYNDHFAPSTCLIDILAEYTEDVISNYRDPSEGPSTVTFHLNRVLSSNARHIVQCRVQLLTSLFNSPCYPGDLVQANGDFVLQNSESILFSPTINPDSCAHTDTDIPCPGPLRYPSGRRGCSITRGIFRTLQAYNPDACGYTPSELIYLTTAAAIASTSFAFDLNTDSDPHRWVTPANVATLHDALYVPSDQEIVEYTPPTPESASPTSPSYSPTPATPVESADEVEEVEPPSEPSTSGPSLQQSGTKRPRQL